MKNRIITFDIARALCVLWIVGFWHMNQYLSDDILLFPTDSMKRNIALEFTNGVLALFTLLSGYFMSIKSISSGMDIKGFYMQRVKRFMIPLFASCVLLFVLHYIRLSHVFSICIGISQFCPPPFPKTLWFFSMIVFFYITTPWILLIKDNVYKIYCIIFLLGVLWVLDIQDITDPRLLEYSLFYYIPFFVKFDSGKVANCVCGRVCMGTMLVISLIVFLLYSLVVSFNNFPILLFKRLAICMWILVLSIALSYNRRLSSLFFYMSYASMLAYLFHRELYIIVHYLIGDFNIYIACLCVLLLFVTSFYAQKLYDKLIKNVK